MWKTVASFLLDTLDLLDLDQSKTFYKPDWFEIVGSEVKCCKEAVCVIDMSSFTKFEISVSSAGVTGHSLPGAACSFLMVPEESWREGGQIPNWKNLGQNVDALLSCPSG